MRTFYRVEIPRYKLESESMREGVRYMNYGIDYTQIYLIAAESIKEALSKVPPAEDKRQITKITIEGQLVIVD